ncbi:endonuclease/exonuclease/phosphatase family protein [Planctomonas psychrotolerans]|uniref:endonuclease/exonuclease/phosphatase family protein n=1 Tax=Planctomonas psychrotolerans TaxID=2528712 RepID=UPI00123C5762|nr:endonuclease/exonuclease/phosphatase family protein [Planctomonas psychrotolerans]
MIGPAERDTLHIASYNLRYAKTGVAPGNPDYWPEREPVLARWLQIERPTILGVQEALYSQVGAVARALPPSYRWVGMGREGGSRGEFCAIFYAAARLDLVGFDHLWLSDTPDAIGSRSWGNEVPRMVTEAHFRDRTTGIEFAVLNTHLDNHDDNSREQSARAIVERIRTQHSDVPVIVTGDFNAPAGDSPSFDILTEGAGLRDTWVAASRRVTAEYGTRPDYTRPVQGGPRIDWVLASDRVEVLTAAIDPFTSEGRAASDHLPVQALVRLR